MFSTNLSIRLATIFCSYLLYNNASFLQVLSNKTSSFIHFLLKIKKRRNFFVKLWLQCCIYMHSCYLKSISSFSALKIHHFSMLLVCFYEFIAKFWSSAELHWPKKLSKISVLCVCVYVVAHGIYGKYPSRSMIYIHYHTLLAMSISLSAITTLRCCLFSLADALCLMLGPPRPCSKFCKKFAGFLNKAAHALKCLM